MKIVLDTNVYIAAALSPRGFSQDILKQSAKDYFTIVASEEILKEIQDKLRKKFKWTEEETDSFLNRIRKFIEIVEPSEKVKGVSRDPKDDKILECALAGKANLIVSLDQDLIKLKNFRGIGIVHTQTLVWTFPEYFRKRS